MLSGMPPAPRGVPQVEVTFDIDANGILNVKAKDKATGKEQSITITASTGLSKDEIERMKKEADTHAAEDQKKKELIDLRNTAETIIYTTEKMLKDAGDLPDGKAGKVKADDKKAIEEKMEALRKVLAKGESASGGKDSDDKEAIKKAADDLAQTAQKVGAAMYSASSADKQQQGGGDKKEENPPASEAGKDDKKKDKTVEGEFEEVK